MEKNIYFHKKLGANNVVRIPKRIVTNNHLWVGEKVMVKIHFKFREIKFTTTIKKGFLFTIPKPEAIYLEVNRGGLILVEITPIK